MKSQKVFSYESIISKQNLLDTSLSLSKYPNCLFIFINSTGFPGSILQSTASPSTVQQEQYDSQELTEKYIYTITTVFGSTDIVFYELLLRRICTLVYEETNIQHQSHIILNVALPIKNKTFSEEAYYKAIIQQIKKGLDQII